jgi:undecaprenyl-diphosphatase
MNLSELNISWFRVINNLGIHHPLFNPIFEFLAEYTVYILVVGFLYYWFTRVTENRLMIMNATFSFLLAEIAGKTAGLFYRNNQPFAELDHVNQLIQKSIDNSFPSDHTILFFSISFSIWLVHKNHGFVWLILAVFTAISRIGVGVHYPFDVLVGALFGILSAITVMKFALIINFTGKLLTFYEKIEHLVLPTKKQSKDI